MQVKKNLKTKTRIFDFKLPDFKNVKLGLFEIFLVLENLKNPGL